MSGSSRPPIRDIHEAIRQNNFREDLYHRLNVVQFRPPPLRERGSDTIILAENFLSVFNASMNKAHSQPDLPAANKQVALPQLARQACANCWQRHRARGSFWNPTLEIQPSSLPDFNFEGRLRKTDAPIVTGNKSLDEIMSEFERQLINSTLEQCRFNISKTAEQLKISRHALRYRMQRLNIASGTDEEDTTTAGPKED